MDTTSKKILSAALLLSTSIVFADSLNFIDNLGLGSGSAILEAGMFSINPGESQSINMVALVGDRYSARKSFDQNIIFGLAYLFKGPQVSSFNTSYGISVDYLAKTEFSGTIYQEHIAPNLRYYYNLEHVPVHAVTKIESNKVHDQYTFTAEAGIGPNFLNLYNYKEKSLDSITLPNNSFSKSSDTTFSGRIGFGLKMKDVFDQNPLECGYRLFYLGHSKLERNNAVVLDKLKTGDMYAHAIICSLAVS